MKKGLLLFFGATTLIASFSIYYFYQKDKAAENYKVPKKVKEQIKEVKKSGGGSYGGLML